MIIYSKTQRLFDNAYHTTTALNQHNLNDYNIRSIHYVSKSPNDYNSICLDRNKEGYKIVKYLSCSITTSLSDFTFYLTRCNGLTIKSTSISSLCTT